MGIGRTALLEFMWPMVGMAIALVVLFVTLFRLRSWWRENTGPAVPDYELLGEYREMFRRGELSDEEFRLIRSRLAPRIGGKPPSPPTEAGTMRNSSDFETRS